jgi:hypothetical protein
MTDYYISENDLQTYNDYFDTYTLEHHGIRGQRWGRKMGPPYPLDAGDHSAAEKKAGWRQSLDDAANKIRSATEKLKEEFGGKKSSGSSETPKQEQPKTETPEEKEAREKAERRAVIESANANTIAANASKLSTQELQEAVNRMNLMAQVNSKITPEPTMMDKINAGIDKLDKAATTVTKGVDTYNKIAKIYNKFGDPPLPVLDKSLEERRKAAADEAKKVAEEARKEAMNAALRTGDPDKIIKAVNDLKMDPTEIGNANKTYNNMKNLFSASKAKADADKKLADDKAKAEKDIKDAKAATDQAKKETKQAQKAAKQAEKEAKKAEKDAKKAQKEADKKVEDAYKKAAEQVKRERERTVESVSGTVEGEGTSKRQSTDSSNSGSSRNMGPIDVDYEEVSNPYVPAVRNSSTSSFTSERRNSVVAALESRNIDTRFLLEDKRR